MKQLDLSKKENTLPLSSFFLSLQSETIVSIDNSANLKEETSG